MNSTEETCSEVLRKEKIYHDCNLNFLGTLRAVSSSGIGVCTPGVWFCCFVFCTAHQSPGQLSAPFSFTHARTHIRTHTHTCTPLHTHIHFCSHFGPTAYSVFRISVPVRIDVSSGSSTDRVLAGHPEFREAVGGWAPWRHLLGRHPELREALGRWLMRPLLGQPELREAVGRRLPLARLDRDGRHGACALVGRVGPTPP